MSPPGVSGKLLRRVRRACRPSLDEPNIALNLEICDLINQKQGNLPREAAVAVVRLVNSRDPQIAELALTLLDYLVKNCGYPIHLQISRKEFLNELVKRFPERPPAAYTRIQRLILGEIAEWVQTICRTSRYKEDLGYIRDMYRLLRTNQKKVESELEKVGRKADLLNEMLDNATNAGKIDSEDDTLYDLISAVRVARPKLQKIISEESGDDDAVAKLLALNDKLNAVLKKSDLLTGGHAADAAQVKVPGSSDAVGDLIDFDDDDDSAPADSGSALGGSTINPQNSVAFDLLGSGDTSSSGAKQPSVDPLADLLGDLGDLSIGTPSTNVTTGSSTIAGVVSPMSSESPAPVSDSVALGVSGRSSFTAIRKPTPFSESSNLKITFTVNSKLGSNVDITFHFSNLSITKSITNMQFSLAPASGSDLKPGVTDGLTQVAHITQRENQQFDSLKLKFKCSYKLDGVGTVDSGMVSASV
ncbi:hypothetical protein HII13_000436 [Brettanomyces bruxellensis]|nr:hypothetical protein HII13_000436 [Brettanomyces bruxellensis]